MRLSTLVLPLLVAASLSACKRDQPGAEDAPREAAATTAPAAAPAAAAPAAPAAAAPATAAAGKAFDLQSVPVTNKALPPFPYVSLPAELDNNHVHTERDLDFDRLNVLTGEVLHKVEGRVLIRRFAMEKVKWSSLAAHRNYENVLTSLGATRVDALHPTNEAFLARNGGDKSAIWKKMGLPYLNRMEDAEIPGFEQWLIRTPETNIWISFYVDAGDVGLLTVEEKAMKQGVQALPVAGL
jgi:hypothetical protein